MRLRYLLAAWSVLVLATSCAPPGTQTLETPTTREGDRGVARVPAVAVDCEAWSWNTSEFFVQATLEEVRDCLAAGANARQVDEYGRTPLDYAAWYTDDPAIIRALLDAGAEVNARNESGWTPLHYAAWYTNNPAIIRALLDAGAEVNARNESGWTPLHNAAAASDNPDIIAVLLDAGAEVNARNESGWTPWDLAKDREEFEGSDTYQRLRPNEPPLAAPESPSSCAEWNTEEFFESATLTEVRGCLAAEVEVDARDGLDVTPLHYAAEHSTDPAVIHTLVRSGARVNARGSGGRTPLHRAAGFNPNPAIITALIAAGAEVNARDEGGLTPLHDAAWYNDNPAVIEALVVAGAEVNAQAANGWTPLHLATYEATSTTNPAVVTTLLDAGADATVRSENGQTPWDHAQDNEALKGTDAYWRLNDARFR